MADGIKGFLLHRLTLRIFYTVVAYTSTSIVAFLSSDHVRLLLAKSGIALVDSGALKACITGLLFTVGEFIFHFVHEGVIVPQTVPPKGDIQP